MVFRLPLLLVQPLCLSILNNLPLPTIIPFPMFIRVFIVKELGVQQITDPEKKTTLGSYSPWRPCARRLGIPRARKAVTSSCPLPIKDVIDCGGVNRNGSIAQCHRFDQSAISIILARLFRVHYDNFIVDMNWFLQTNAEMVHRITLEGTD